MTREIIKITSEEQWLALRMKDITSTKMAALLDMSPYSTAFEVYHAQRSGLQVPFDATDRMRKGQRIEAYIANEIAILKGWEVRPIEEYIRIPELNMAASFDFEYTKPCGTVGIMEIKGVDYFQHKQNWDPADMEGGETTPYIEVQLQHQFECADRYEEGVIVAATSIYDFHIYERKRDREFGAALRDTVKTFWADVSAGNEPEPNFYRDGKVIDELYRNAGGEPVDMSDNSAFNALVAEYAALGIECSTFDKKRRAVKAEIHRVLEVDGGAFTDDFKVTATWTKDSEGKMITEDMVGTITGARKGYRQCRVTALRK